MNKTIQPFNGEGKVHAINADNPYGSDVTMTHCGTLLTEDQEGVLTSAGFQLKWGYVSNKAVTCKNCLRGMAPRKPKPTGFYLCKCGHGREIFICPECTQCTICKRIGCWEEMTE